MNKVAIPTLIAVCLLSSWVVQAQTQGISYQAVIIDTQPKEIPGIDLEGNYLPNAPLTVRFTIVNDKDQTDYQEVHNTTTDEFGMINLMIGQGTPTPASPVIFTEIDWDGTPKDLRVEISLGEATSNFTEFSLQQLTFVPYAFHRNITATGTLTVDGKATFNGESEFSDLTVQGTTNLNGPLNVNNASAVNFSGDLTVAGSTTLAGDLTIEQLTTLNDTLIVNGITGLNGQVTIDADVNGSDTNYDAYPLRVQGSNQGIAIRVDGSRNTSNNFVTFFDSQGIHGRIEGQTNVELLTDPEYIFDNSVLVAQEAIAITNQVASDASTTTCVGAGVCQTVPIFSLIVASAANVAVQTAQVIGYNAFKQANIGVTYQSGGADYAEWLPKRNPQEKFYAGDVVGIRNGMVQKETDNAEFVMVISQRPAVLGNIPEEGMEDQSEKIAFMGQVPVKVIGTVVPGDYILPSGGNNGFGIAKHPQAMMVEDYARIVGVAWSGTTGEGFDLVNVAVGLNTNDLVRVVEEQQRRIAALESKLNQLQERQQQSEQALSSLVPGYAEAMQVRRSPEVIQSATPSPVIRKDSERKIEIIKQDQTITYHAISRDQIIAGIDLAKKLLAERGTDVDSNPFFTRIDSDPVYREEVIARMTKAIQTQLDRSVASDRISN